MRPYFRRLTLCLLLFTPSWVCSTDCKMSNDLEAFVLCEQQQATSEPTPQPSTSGPTQAPIPITSSPVTSVPTSAPTRSPTTPAPVSTGPTKAPTNAPITESPTREPRKSPVIAPTTPPTLPSQPETSGPTSKVYCGGLSARKRATLILAVLSDLSPAEFAQQTSENVNDDLAIISSLQSRSYGEDVVLSPQSLAMEWILLNDRRKVCPPPTVTTDGNGSDSDADLLTDKLIQRYVLAVLYYSTNGDGWKDCAQHRFSDGSDADSVTTKCHNNGDMPYLSEHSECNWFGVGCDEDGRVTSITLDTNNLSGQLPREIVHLSHLGSLKCNDNKLTDEIPQSIGDLSSLEVLDLGNNTMVGGLPDAVWTLEKLQTLNLGSNQFTGTLSSSTAIGALSDLSSLSLQNNNLTGSISDEVCNLRSSGEGTLKHLSTDCNPFLASDGSSASRALVDCRCCSHCFPVSYPADTNSPSPPNFESYASLTCSTSGDSMQWYSNSSSLISTVVNFWYEMEVETSDARRYDLFLVENAIAEAIAADLLLCSSRRQRHLGKSSPLGLGSVRRHLGMDKLIALNAFPPDTREDSCASHSGTTCSIMDGFLTLTHADNGDDSTRNFRSLYAIQTALKNRTLEIASANADEDPMLVQIRYIGPKVDEGDLTPIDGSSTPPAAALPAEESVQPSNVSNSLVVTGTMVVVAVALAGVALAYRRRYHTREGVKTGDASTFDEDDCPDDGPSPADVATTSSSQRKKRPWSLGRVDTMKRRRRQRRPDALPAAGWSPSNDSADVSVIDAGYPSWFHNRISEIESESEVHDDYTGSVSDLNSNVEEFRYPDDLDFNFV